MRRALVIGMGKSGLAAAELLCKLGYAVVGADQQRRPVPPGVDFVLEGEALSWEGIEKVVVSPGVSPEHPLYKEAKRRTLEVVGEAELALSHFSGRCVAVTGTNGKTTVTLLTAHLLREAGIAARALGNVGDPLASYVLAPPENEVIVVELSSYQLETLHAQVFEAAVVLNITADHLERYFDMRAYAETKCHLQRCVLPRGVFYVHADVAAAWSGCLLSGYRVFGEDVAGELPGSLSGLSSLDQSNALAAWHLCQPFGLTAEQFFAGVKTFRKPPHRIEFVAEIDGVQFFDDSKGTNVDAVVQAVRAMCSPVVLIVGGVDKGASYLPWKEFAPSKVKCLLTLGAAAPKIEEELASYFDCQRVKTLDEAVQKGQDYAKAGECVLLSPGCSSFDQFRDYVHRGEEFQRAVLSLKKGREGL